MKPLYQISSNAITSGSLKKNKNSPKLVNWSFANTQSLCQMFPIYENCI